MIEWLILSWVCGNYIHFLLVLVFLIADIQLAPHLAYLIVLFISPLLPLPPLNVHPAAGGGGCFLGDDY